MKTCAFCGSSMPDTKETCPNCGSTDFKKKCDVCGTTYDGIECPKCAQKRQETAAEQQQNQQKLNNIAKANDKLGIKTAVTIFLPFVGGYFLIAPHVKKGFRIFGIIWCVFCALCVAITPNPLATKIIGSLICLLPLFVYIVRIRMQNGGQVKQSMGLIVLLAFALAFSLMFAATSPSGNATNNSDLFGTNSNSKLSIGDTAEFADMSVTIDSPTSAMIIEQYDSNGYSDDQAYILFPVTITANSQTTISASDFGAVSVDKQGSFKDNVQLSEGDVYTANLFIPWKPASRDTEPSLRINPAPKSISMQHNNLKANWSIDYSNSQIKQVDASNALTVVYGTTIQAKAQFYRYFDSYSKGFVEFKILGEQFTSGYLTIECEIPKEQIAAYKDLHEGQNVVVQGVVGNITADVEGVFVSEGLYMENITLIS